MVCMKTALKFEHRETVFMSGFGPEIIIARSFSPKVLYVMNNPHLSSFCLASVAPAEADKGFKVPSTLYFT